MHTRHWWEINCAFFQLFYWNTSSLIKICCKCSKQGKSDLDIIWSCSGNCFTVNGLRDQLDDLKRRNQNSHISNEKNIHLQKQVRHWQMQCFKGAHCCKETLLSTYGHTSSSSSLAYSIFSFFSCFFLCSPAGGSQHFAAGWVWGSDKASQNPDREQQAAAAAGGQCPGAAGQMLPAGA